MAQQPMHGMPEVTVERDLPVTMADGVTLYADVYRPAAQGPHPVVLISHPYDKAGAQSNFVGYLHPSQYARHGYIAVSQDCRGRYSSEGTFLPFVHEVSDVLQTIDWCAGLPGSDGRVAMYGFSYAGINQLLAAAEQPVALAAVAPAFTAGSPYSEWFYRQGAFSLAFAASWANFLAMDMAARRKDDAALGAYAGALGNAGALYWVLPLSAHPALGSDDTRFYHDWLAHPTFDEYWEPFEIDHSKIAVPGLHVGGWWDIFVRGNVRNYRELARHSKAPQKLVIGPWLHMPWDPLGGATGDVRHLGRGRLAAALLGPRAQGQGDRRLRQRRHRLRDERGLARPRRLAALRRAAHGLVSALCRPSPDRLRRRRSLNELAGGRAP